MDDEERTGRPKRADLPTADVLRAVAVFRTGAWEHLCSRFPAKIVLAAMQRDVDHGLLNYGVALRRPWLTVAGSEWLREDLYRNEIEAEYLDG